MSSLTLTRLQQRFAQVAWGRERTAERLLAAVLAEGHVLIEDVPGVGKTRLSRALRRCSAPCSAASSARRISCLLSPR